MRRKWMTMSARNHPTAGAAGVVVEGAVIAPAAQGQGHAAGVVAAAVHAAGAAVTGVGAGAIEAAGAKVRLKNVKTPRRSSEVAAVQIQIEANVSCQMLMQIVIYIVIFMSK